MTTLIQRSRSALVRGVLGEDRYRRLTREYTRRKQRPRIGRVDFGDLRVTEPLCGWYGRDRGGPIDRYYIENFLDEHRAQVSGRVLEIGERTYTERFGAGVTQADMLHVDDVDGATYVADLADAPSIPSDAYDCVIITQTLQMIYDVRAAVATLHRILKPGGVLLCTVPGVTQLADPRWNRTWYWSFTPLAAERLIGDEFGAGAVTVGMHGNVLAVTSFLQGLTPDDLTTDELDVADPSYPMIVTVEAVKNAQA
ncbi:MAG: methyltransferase domain-containing protein [Gordonia sp. (in: high G+C Gram-positive bacteria)]